ncbi:MAG: FAD-binding protein [Deltaproteobacteria bacterium]|nr:MAG: FAD-binding protein [Deltaproteobacteria bacterium]
MPLENLIETDVLVVGGGLAGCFAAIRAKELGQDVTLVEKAYVSRSGGSSFAGGYFEVFNPEWGHDFSAWMEHFTTIGEYVNDRDWVKIILEESYPRFQDLISWNVPFFKDAGEFVKFRFGPVCESLIMPRREFMPVVRSRVLEKGVKVLDRVMLTDLLEQDGRVFGAVGFHTRDGDFYTFKSKATILATGSGSFKAIGSPNDYWTSDGESMAYKVGAQITGKEFGGKHGTTLRAFPAWRGTGNVGVICRRYVNAEGQDITTRYATGYRGLAPDRFHSIYSMEAHAGRAPLYWDLDSVMPEQREKMIEHQKATGTTREAERIGLDITKGGKIPVVGGCWPGDQGPGKAGIVVDKNCATAIPGLYAIGDNAGTRHCGSSYTEAGFGLCGAAVTGYRGGQSAAEYALNIKKPGIDVSKVEKLKEDVFSPLQRKGGFSPSWVTQILQNIMVPYFIWQVKHGARMQAALTLVEFVEDHLGTMLLAKDPHELRKAHEVRNMALNAEMGLRTSLFRTESRGSHYREDYPRRDDPGWLAWTVLKEEQGKMQLFKEPLPKEWWPDLSKSYEERYDYRFPGET